jgi:hypothetical protein
MNVDELVMLPKDGGGVYWDTPTAARAAATRSLNILPSGRHGIAEEQVWVNVINEFIRRFKY